MVTPSPKNQTNNKKKQANKQKPLCPSETIMHPWRKAESCDSWWKLIDPTLLVSLVCIHSSKSSEEQQPYNTKMTIFHKNSVHRRPCRIGSEVPNAGHVDRAVYITKDVERDDNPVNRSIVCHDIETDTLLCLLVRTYKTLCHSKSYYR